MSNRIELEFASRLRRALLDGFSLKDVPRWVRENTFLNFRPFSFKDHEPQERILLDQSRIRNVKKPSQIGMSELTIRETLAILDILPGIHGIYTLPTASFASSFAKTRVDAVIQGSPYLQSRINRNIDSGELKQIGLSYLHMKGTVGNAAPISVPASLLVHDEVNFSDLDTLSQYQSRLTHSPYKLERWFSTPTVPGYGIDERMAISRRFLQFVKCNRCAHQFYPNYFEHVVIPGWDRNLREINKETLHTLRWKEAAVLCPRCGREPSLAPEHREWVLENPTEAHDAVGYQVQPFDFPKIVTVPDLVRMSTTYKRYVDFVNFGLGMSEADRDNGLTENELKAVWVRGETPRFSRYVLGMDLGATMHLMIAGITPTGQVYVVLMKRFALHEVDEEMVKIYQAYPMMREVFDAYPYTDLVLRYQRTRTRLFGARFSDDASTELFTLRQQEENEERGKMPLREIIVRRNLCFDTLATAIRAGEIVISESACGSEKKMWIEHCMGMTRVQQFDKRGELVFNWQKPSHGKDHYWHTTAFLMLAAMSATFGNVTHEHGLLLRTMDLSNA